MKLQLIFISSLNSEKASGCQMKEKNSCLKALAWLDLSEGYLSLSPSNFD